MPALAHFGIGLVSKKFAPKIPLWVLLSSAMLIDILNFVFTIMNLGIAWSHSVFMAVIWSITASAVTAIIMKFQASKSKEINKKGSISSPFRTSMVIGLVVFSHCVLDIIGWPMTVINPDLGGVPLFFDMSQTIGIGIYSTWIGALVMDIGVFIVGLLIYFRTRINIKNVNKKI